MSKTNWVVKSSTYGDKKKSKLWIMVYLENTNNYNELEELYERLLISVLFTNGEFKEIVYIEHNGEEFIEEKELDDRIVEMIKQSAIEISRKYMK